MEVYYKHGVLFFETNGKIVYQTILFFKKKESLFAKWHWTERVFRLEPKTAILLNSDCLLSCHGYIYRCNWQQGIISKEHQYRKSMNNPVHFCEIENIKGFEDGILYGEYWGNTNREEVRVFQRTKHGWKIKYTFPSDSITHIHGFVCDAIKNRILILTGDMDNDSGIWEATNDFKCVRPILIGKQQYRSCVAFVHNDDILYATDTPLEQNYIYTYNENKKELKRICEISGPCIYGRQYIDEKGCKQYLFATSVEPDSRIRGWRYLLTYKLGEGVHDRRTHIYKGNPEQGFSEICALRKDYLPMGLFQFGNIYFPDSENLVCVPQAVGKYSGKTWEIFG